MVESAIIDFISFNKMHLNNDHDKVFEGIKWKNKRTKEK